MWTSLNALPFLFFAEGYVNVMEEEKGATITAVPTALRRGATASAMVAEDARWKAAHPEPVEADFVLFTIE